MSNTKVSPADRSGLADYFRYHGIWAPGVRSFRVMNFAGKSSLIAIAFLVPVLVLGALFVPARLDAIRRTELERSSLAYTRDAVLLLRRAQEYRSQALLEASQQPGGDSARARQALDAQIEKLGERDRTLGAALGTTPVLAKALEQLKSVAPPAEGLLKVYASNARFIEKLYTLIAAAADGGGLTLDPELVATSLTSVGAVRLPRMIDEAERMGALAAATAAVGQGGDIAKVELNRLDTLVEDRSREVGSSIAKVLAVNPQAAAALDPAAALKTLDALRDEATDEPGSGGAEKAARLHQLTERALEAAWGEQGRVLALLGNVLDARAQALHTSLLWVGTAVAVSLALAGYMLYSFFLVMNGGLAEARRHLDRMAEGDLTSTPSPWGRDDAADLMASLLRMQAAVREIVSGVRGTAEQIASSTLEIAQGVGDISSRTERTAGNLQQTSSSMSDISATVAETAETADRAAELAHQSASVAAEGASTVEVMVEKMQAIHASSKRIGDIIGVIDAIAFQTNILALNAAVEAARAGEQGRGFAVVASEVRVLAQRTTAAAREVRQQIGSSVENVEAGAQAVESAGATMKRVVANVDGVRGLLGRIAEGARRQRQAVTEISGSVRELDDSSQQNASLSEQAAAATSELEQQSSELLARVARFRLVDAA